MLTSTRFPIIDVLDLDLDSVEESAVNLSGRKKIHQLPVVLNPAAKWHHPTVALKRSTDQIQMDHATESWISPSLPVGCIPLFSTIEFTPNFGERHQCRTMPRAPEAPRRRASNFHACCDNRPGRYGSRALLPARRQRPTVTLFSGTGGERMRSKMLH